MSFIALTNKRIIQFSYNYQRTRDMCVLRYSLSGIVRNFDDIAYRYDLIPTIDHSQLIKVIGNF